MDKTFRVIIVAGVIAFCVVPSSAQRPPTTNRIPGGSVAPSTVTAPCAGQKRFRVILRAPRDISFTTSRPVNRPWTTRLRASGELQSFNASGTPRKCTETTIDVDSTEPEVMDAFRTCVVMGMVTNTRLILDVSGPTPGTGKNMILLAGPTEISCYSN